MKTLKISKLTVGGHSFFPKDLFWRYGGDPSLIILIIQDLFKETSYTDHFSFVVDEQVVVINSSSPNIHCFLCVGLLVSYCLELQKEEPDLKKFFDVFLSSTQNQNEN